MRNSKIAVYICIKDISLNGGGERIVVNYANEFAKQYPFVNIVSYFKTNSDIRYPIDSRVKVHYVDPKATFEPAPQLGVQYLFHSWNFGRKLGIPLQNLIKANTPEGYSSMVLFVGYEQLPGIKPDNTWFIGVDGSNAITSRGRTLIEKAYNAVLRYLYRRLDVVGVLSDQELERWANLGKPVRILTNFVSDIPQQVPPQKGREKSVLAAGRMDCGMKGFDRLIKAYARIAEKYPDWTLKIFGEGILKEEYQQLIDYLGAGKYIKLMPFSRNIFEEYKKASIFAMSSRYEPFGLVTTEAMVYGMAVIGIEGITPSGTAFILKPHMSECLAAQDDMNDFTEKLEKMIRDEEWREKMAQHGRREVLERFSPQAQMSIWNKLFDELTV